MLSRTPLLDMNKMAKVCFAGIAVSFLGALPLGTLNLTAFDIAATQSWQAAVWFAIAVVLVELFVVGLTLLGREQLQIGQRLANYLLPLGVILLLYLSISSFQAAAHTSAVETKIALFPKIGSAFVLGLLLSTLNPLQVPFWITWNEVLLSKGILEKSRRLYRGYLAGIGTGTLLGLGLFILAGKYIFSNYAGYSSITNLVMGTLYLGFSIYLMYLFFKKRLNLKIQ